VRRYPSFLVAEVTTAVTKPGAAGDKDARSQAFNILAKYIGVFGTAENELPALSKSESIAMTAPVLMEPAKISMTAPVVRCCPPIASKQAPRMRVVVSLSAPVPPSTLRPAPVNAWYSRKCEIPLR
jgi:SOUL heme-binding protein